jgi:four helix bundle protein
MEDEQFDFEKLIAWQKAIAFVDDILVKTEEFNNSKGNFRLREQLDSCSASIPMNIAEGKGRSSNKSFVLFLYYSRGSLNETITVLKLLNMRKWLSDADYAELRLKGHELKKILNALIKSMESKP